MAKGNPTFSLRCFSVNKLQESLSEDPPHWPMLGLTIKERQERALLWAGGRWAQEEEAAQIWLREDAFVSEDALKLFIQKIGKQEEIFLLQAIALYPIQKTKRFVPHTLFVCVQEERS